jgi:hypothetical protein
MNGGIEEPDDALDVDDKEDEVLDTDVVASLEDDNIGDLSVELNVEELVANLEPGGDEESEHRQEIRRKLEEKREQREQELDSTYNINLDEDV